jgi:hypothetical protein
MQGYMKRSAIHTPLVVGSAQSSLPALSLDAKAFRAPKAANENLQIKSDWMTPAEALQVVLRIKRKLAKENRENLSLFHSAARRKVWDEINACEQCLRWMYFRNLH